ncbi:MAG: methyltransferase [Alistipes sp.]|nr:methyltransferase [Alistipes sp.]
MFRFKQFTISDEGCAMKVGTDGVLLGAWADVADDGVVLDACTGTGIIALMVAQRNAEASIYALDIVPEAVVEARGNADHSPWGDRVRTICCDLKEYREDVRFDHIVCNPPYFVDALQATDVARNLARHTVSLDFESLVAAAERLLKDGGRFSVILPTEGAAHFRRVAFSRLWLRRVTDVVTTEGGAPKRTLMEFVRCAQPLMPRCDVLTIHHRGGDYTEEYRRLTQDFYLMF